MSWGTIGSFPSDVVKLLIEALEGVPVSIESNSPRSRAYSDSYEVDARLASLGVKREWLEEATWQGQIERRFTSHLEFPGAPAYKAASKGLEVLRERSTKEAGWHPDSYLGIPVSFNGEGTVAVAVTEGDEFTGILGEKDPSTKAIKGPNTRKAVDENRLFQDPPVSFWYLLTFSDGERLWAELSCPAIEEGGRVTKWEERILLGEIKRQAGTTSLPESMPPASDAPEITVRRRPA